MTEFSRVPGERRPEMTVGKELRKKLENEVKMLMGGCSWSGRASKRFNLNIEKQRNAQGLFAVLYSLQRTQKERPALDMQLASNFLPATHSAP